MNNFEEKLETEVSELKSIVASLRSEVELGKETERALSAQIAYVKTEKEKLQQVFSEQQQFEALRGNMRASDKRREKEEKNLIEAEEARKKTDEKSKQLSDLKNRIMASAGSDIGKLEEYEDLPRVRNMGSRIRKQSEKIQHSDMKKNPDANDIVSLYR